MEEAETEGEEEAVRRAELPVGAAHCWEEQAEGGITQGLSAEEIVTE